MAAVLLAGCKPKDDRLTGEKLANAEKQASAIRKAISGAHWDGDVTIKEEGWIRVQSSECSQMSADSFATLAGGVPGGAALLFCWRGEDNWKAKIK